MVAVIIVKSAEHASGGLWLAAMIVSFSGPAISFRAPLTPFATRSRPSQLPKDSRPSRVWKIEVPLEEGQGRGRGLQGPGPPGRTPAPPRAAPRVPPLARVRAAVTSPGPREVGRRGPEWRGVGVAGMAGVALLSPAAAARAAGGARGGRCLGWFCSTGLSRARSGSACSPGGQPEVPPLPRCRCSGARGSPPGGPSASAGSFPSGSLSASLAPIPSLMILRRPAQRLPLPSPPGPARLL